MYKSRQRDTKCFTTREIPQFLHELKINYSRANFRLWFVAWAK